MPPRIRPVTRQSEPVRLYRTDQPTPCTDSSRDGDRWFSPFKDRIHAVRACQACPFIGRCGYNAVAAREEYGVWGGLSLPGDRSTPELLEHAYRHLLAQFERRHITELGESALPAMPDPYARRRQASANHTAA
ncbi:transcription factor WhiB [Mycolicibacterium cosmeticum]|uniref:Transcription factor WhiB n=1 Tax=Mycolicibacterium cosmeticum TaxID=258533 RepID=W9B980_MYCCO|nr:MULTISPECIES: WhiB family transcriptional regulator [Mycolicibacterium]MCX2715828.1 WhiB family transcriptional regulator [Mycolicibacterium sp. J2]TLH65092.1 transcription factor WhiB [Mycolicibacterium cosmeticum]CDO11487.1 Transcription factor WhiB [Mycolicibacterium cosmeticum]